MGRADRASIGVTSILNGAFLELLDGDMPLIQSRIRRVLFWGDADQVLDFTAKDDVAAYTAAAALDPGTPRILRIAGDSLSVRDMSRILSDTTDGSFRPLRAGGLTSMSAMIGVAKRLAPGDDAVFPAWQGMQYTRDMFDGRVRLDPLDNDRYPDVSWTSVRTASWSALPDPTGCCGRPAGTPPPSTATSGVPDRAPDCCPTRR